MYINTGINHNTIEGAFKRASASKLIHDAVLGVQHSLEKYEGELIKVYNDDEELTITCGFGLPPMSHKDDELRSCLCAMDICVRGVRAWCSSAKRENFSHIPQISLYHSRVREHFQSYPSNITSITHYYHRMLRNT